MPSPMLESDLYRPPTALGAVVINGRGKVGVLRVLVLGGNRYIGLSLVRELAGQGFDVTVANSHVVNLPHGVDRVHVDRRDPTALVDALAPHARSFDVVFDNTAYQVADLEPLVELFDGHIRRYVFTSSVAVYRRSYVQPVAEHFRLHEVVADEPLRAYGVGKVLCERFLADRFARTGFPVTSVRVSHTIGPRSPLVDREPILFARLEQGRPIFIPGDGFPFVHLIHIDDAARLLVALATSERATGEVFNAAGLELTSILGCIHLMARTVGVDPDIVFVPTPIARQLLYPLLHWGEGLAGGAVFSMAKTLAATNWKPRFGLESAYQDSYAWFRDAGREGYDYRFDHDDEILALVGRNQPDRLPD